MLLEHTASVEVNGVMACGIVSTMGRNWGCSGAKKSLGKNHDSNLQPLLLATDTIPTFLLVGVDLVGDVGVGGDLFSALICSFWKKFGSNLNHFNSLSLGGTAITLNLLIVMVSLLWSCVALILAKAHWISILSRLNSDVVVKSVGVVVVIIWGGDRLVPKDYIVVVCYDMGKMGLLIWSRGGCGKGGKVGVEKCWVGG